MRRIVVIAAGMAGITAATRIKRRLPASETVLVIPAGLEKLRATCDPASPATGPAARRLAPALPDMVRLPTRGVGIVETHDIMPDFAEKEVTLTSSRGSVTIRYSDLILDAPATVRLPRSLQNAANVFAWPLPGFSAQPQELDAALAEAANKNLPVVVVGKGIAALDAALLAKEAGAAVHWLQTGEAEVPDADPLLLQLALNVIGPGLKRTRMPETSPDRLAFRVGQEGSQEGYLEGIALEDGSLLRSPCFLWTAPRMGRHPILREAGVSLDAYGRLQVEEGELEGLYIMGNGSALDPAHLPGTEAFAPLYPGCEDCAEASAALCINSILEGGEDNLNIGSFGIASAHNDELCLWRAGYSLAEATESGLEAEYAVVSMPRPDAAAPCLVLALVCSRQDRNILGAQVLGIGDAFRMAAEGLFGMCVAALAEGSAVDALSLRPDTGSVGRLLSQAASILKNKLEGAINGISPDELLASHAAGAEFFTLDLRPLQDWQAGHVPRAYNIPLLQLKKRLQDEVPQFTPLVLISEDGTDAYAAACKLAALGASSLYVLDGGMRLWPYELERE